MCSLKWVARRVPVVTLLRALGGVTIFTAQHLNRRGGLPRDVCWFYRLKYRTEAAPSGEAWQILWGIYRPQGTRD